MNKLKLKILFLILSCIPSLNIFAFNTTKENEEYILITGFEPFGKNAVINSSWEAVKHLQNSRFYDKKVIVAQLPVVWDEAGKKLQSLIQKYHPAAVVSFGQGPIQPVRIETIAHNSRENILDNRGEFPKTSYITEYAPLNLETTLDVKSITEHLNVLDVPVIESIDAGTYLCNEVFYILMNNPGTPQALTIPRGFVHLPPVDSVVVLGENSTYFDVEKLEYVATEIVENVIKNIQ